MPRRSAVCVASRGRRAHRSAEHLRAGPVAILHRSLHVRRAVTLPRSPSSPTLRRRSLPPPVKACRFMKRSGGITAAIGRSVSLIGFLHCLHAARRSGLNGAACRCKTCSRPAGLWFRGSRLHPSGEVSLNGDCVLDRRDGAARHHVSTTRRAAACARARCAQP